LYLDLFEQPVKNEFFRILLMERIPVIEGEDCVGCGSCLEICPEVFTLNEALGKALVINPQGCPESRIEEAIEICPVNCIHWEE